MIRPNYLPPATPVEAYQEENNTSKEGSYVLLPVFFII